MKEIFFYYINFPLKSSQLTSKCSSYISLVLNWILFLFDPKFGIWTQVTPIVELTGWAINCWIIVTKLLIFLSLTN